MLEHEVGVLSAAASVLMSCHVNTWALTSFTLQTYNIIGLSYYSRGSSQSSPVFDVSETCGFLHCEL
jgi:hypothetical protein